MSRIFTAISNGLIFNVVLKKYSLIFCALFIGLLLLPLQGFSGDLDHFEDSFWGAEELRRGYAVFRQYGMRDIYFDKAILSRDNWLVLSAPGSTDDYQQTNLFTQEELAAIQASLDDTNTKLEEQGIVFLVVFPPNKNTIYPEHMPPQIPVLGSQSRLDQVFSYLKQHGKTQVLDLRPALLAEKKVRPVFFSTDTHWNPYGALVATRETVLALQGRYPTLNAYDFADYVKPPAIQNLGDLARNYVPSSAPEEWFGLEPKFGRQWSRFNLSDVMPVMVMTVNQNAALPRVLIYHDSFMIWQYDFVADYFSKATFVWSYQVNQDFVRGEKPDIVILECTERYLPSLISEDSVWNKD